VPAAARVTGVARARSRDHARGSAWTGLGVTLLHIARLIQEINPDLDARILAGFLLNAIAPPVLTRTRDALEANTESLQDAAVALLRGIVAQPNTPR
jgi:hypothetical protein